MLHGSSVYCLAPGLSTGGCGSFGRTSFLNCFSIGPARYDPHTGVPSTANKLKKFCLRPRPVQLQPR